jgi:hypothetical protein
VKGKDLATVAGAAAVVCGALALWAWHFGIPLFPSGLLRDFNAFYCAGDTLNRGGNPFLAEPLGACERIAKPLGLFNLGPNLVMPAPHPGYALALFGLFARLPFVAAAALWTALSLAALALSVVLLRRLTGFPLAACIGSCALSLGYASLALGQVVPITLAAMCAAAWFLQRGNDRAAALCGALSMIEPHVGLPVCLGLFAWRAQTRLVLIGAGLLLAAISWLTLGAPGTLDYFKVVLPAHAISEVPNIKQLSLTYVAHRLGASDELAVRIGDACYLFMLVLGVAAAGRLAARLREPALLTLVPVAFSMLGGPFVHVIEVALAVPAALVLAARVPERRTLFAAAAIVLAIPWTQVFNLGAIFPILAAVVVGLLVYDLVSPKIPVVAGASLLTVAFLMVLFLSISPIPSADAALAASYSPVELAQASWGRYVRIVASANIVLYDAARIPTWAALFALVGGAAAVALGSRSPRPRKAEFAA